jgi:hypothetical protein
MAQKVWQIKVRETSRLAATALPNDKLVFADEWWMRRD